MHRLTLKNTRIGDNDYSKLHLIFDDEQQVILLPLLFAAYLDKTGLNIVFQRIDDGTPRTVMSKRNISAKSIDSYIAHLYKFLFYINELSKTQNTPGVQETFKCDDNFVNHYLNSVLIEKYGVTSLEEHCAALLSYFNFLAFLEIRPPLTLEIYRGSRQLAAQVNERPIFTRYISTKSRFELLLACRSKCERLIMRTGFELGLRSAENCGLLLQYKQNKKGFLLELFEKLNDPQFQNQNEFPYTLKGMYTKRGRSRVIFIKRELLAAMYDYYRTERAEIIANSNNNPDSLFLRADRRFAGTAITARHASNVFCKRKKAAPGLNHLYSYHTLRHCFGTELFHAELQDKEGRETRSQSAALIVVAQRLGHKIGKNGLAPQTTTRYIRMRIKMLEIEADFDNE